MQREIHVLAVHEAEAGPHLDVVGRLEAKLELGTVDTGLRRIDRLESRTGTARERKRIEELLVLVVVIERGGIELEATIHEL